MHFHTGRSCFPATMAELGSYDGDHKTESTDYLALYGKKVTDPWV